MPAAPDPPADWGIQPGYHDVWGTWKTPSEESSRLIRRAMGATTDDPAERPPSGTALRIVRPGERAATDITERATLWLEDGTQHRIRGGKLPSDLPLGYHRIEADTGRSAPHVENLIVAPPRAHLDDAMRLWGVTAQLYAARSRQSWGMGDLRDLEMLIGWARERGAGMVGLNPLHASANVGPPANSPYSPSSRRWRDPLYLDVTRVLASVDVAGSAEAVAAGAALNAGERIDRNAVWELKRSILESVWAKGVRDPAFDRYRAERGDALTVWGTYCALAEQHGASWPSWPTEVRRPNTVAVGQFANQATDRIAFWCWLQFLIEEQFAASGAADVVVTDLAVGFAPDGFDAWQWQDHLATGCRIGAPPDLLGPDGQDWGLPPFVPWKLRGQAYRPFAETLRANLRGARGLRVDHVMGLLRLFWIPPGLAADDGAYVTWNGSELLDVVALESARAGAFVVGEDLGTVDPGIQDLLRERGLLSTRLLWFEDPAPADWPHQAMAAITTHDLPTVAGVWSGVDLADQHAAGVTVPANGDEDFRHRLRVAAHCDDAAPVDDVVVASYRRLAESPCMIVTAALDDLVGAEHRPNVPGTIDEHPNWRIPLPVPLDDLATTPARDDHRRRPPSRPVRFAAARQWVAELVTATIFGQPFEVLSPVPPYALPSALRALGGVGSRYRAVVSADDFQPTFKVRVQAVQSGRSGRGWVDVIVASGSYAQTSQGTLVTGRLTPTFQCTITFLVSLPVGLGGAYLLIWTVWYIVTQATNPGLLGPILGIAFVSAFLLAAVRTVRTLRGALLHARELVSRALQARIPA